MDETDINLFCGRLPGHAPAGERAVIKLPSSKGPNVNVICAVSPYQMSYNSRRRGAFKSNAAKAWLLEMLERLPTGIQVDSVVSACVNAQCHSKLEECITQHPGLNLCRLGPYSPMLNPVETIWSKIKACVRQNMGVPPVKPPSDREQRLTQISPGSIMRAWQHAHGFLRLPSVLNMEDVKVGA